ncbi:hypothetical protein B8W96_00935 [Lentilactobacillus parakefiri]|uniref:GW dipeptide domain-containing protein n=1 Tax=Lentilactobacillus parakefiri TaxID=152332 RepID=UPI000BA726F0|nr:GW dipeptide domain-containing protein [Lentilactobacillus parakefiri]PAL01513.1 hypothetical protein B8W96_00935 [Lentilactobacillus parakefiri]
MNKLRIKQALLGSAALLGMTVAFGVLNGQNAAAAKLTANRPLATPASQRNVTFTGTHALYTKVGTLKGAKVVATRSALAALSQSPVSSDNVRAYRLATTSTGAVYFKVVTFNHKYRGWIYGGRQSGSFNGGLKPYSTFTSQGLSALTAAQQSATYKIAATGTGQDGVTYKQPAWTDYGVGKAITDSTPYANTTFKIDQVGKRTREQDQWVHIVDSSNANSPANGWILLSNLKQRAQTNPTTSADATVLKINLAKPDGTFIKTISWTKATAVTGKTVGQAVAPQSSQWLLNPADQTALQDQINAQLSGTGYQLNGGQLSATQIDQLARGTFGSQINLQVAAVPGKVASTIAPSTFINNNLTDVGDLTGTTSEYGTNPASFKIGDDEKKTDLTATEISQQDPTKPESLAYRIKHLTGTAQSDALVAVNGAFYNAATQQFASNGVNLDGFAGVKGADFSGSDLQQYLKSNLNTLTSPKYPVFSADGSVTYKTITFKLALGNILGGTFGNPVIAFYTYDVYHPQA